VHQLTALIQRLVDHVPSVSAPSSPQGKAVVGGGPSEVDLNRVSEEELRAHKSSMEQDFQKNRLRPGDEGFEYDVQVREGFCM
jgi:centrosomal protein CEP19